MIFYFFEKNSVKKGLLNKVKRPMREGEKQSFLTITKSIDFV